MKASMTTFNTLLKEGDADPALKAERYAQAAFAASNANVPPNVPIRDYAGRYQILVAGYGPPRLALAPYPPISGDDIPA
jgi:hypothetical protein